MNELEYQLPSTDSFFKWLKHPRLNQHKPANSMSNMRVNETVITKWSKTVNGLGAKNSSQVSLKGACGPSI